MIMKEISVVVLDHLDAKTGKVLSTSLYLKRKEDGYWIDVDGSVKDAQEPEAFGKQLEKWRSKPRLYKVTTS